MENNKIMPIALGETDGLSEETWLRWREHGPGFADPMSSSYLPYTLGGSDVAAVFDLSPWKTSLELYHQKIGTQLPIKKEVNSDAKELGHIFENAVAEVFRYWFMKNYPKYQIRVINDTTMYQCGRRREDGTLIYPWAVANLDRRVLINGQEGILEIKTTSNRNIEIIKKWKAGIVPVYYELQCRYYMAVMDVDYCYICCAWGIGLDDMAVIRIDRNMAIEQEILDKCQNFIDCVEQEFEPDPTDCKAELLNEFYYRLYGQVDDSAPGIELPEKYRSIILDALYIEEEIKEKKDALRAAEAQKERIYSSLYPVYQNASYGSFKLSEDQVVYLKLKTPMTRAKFDTERFLKENPELARKYSVPGVDTAKLRKEEPKLYRDYTIPPEPSKDPDKKNSFDISVKELAKKTA